MLTACKDTKILSDFDTVGRLFFEERSEKSVKISNFAAVFAIILLANQLTITD